VLASVACFFAGLCYGEFAAMVPISGSAYSYAYATAGELIAWLIGWSLILEWLFAASVATEPGTIRRLIRAEGLLSGRRRSPALRAVARDLRSGGCVRTPR
jgi:hypothetical protein